MESVRILIAEDEPVVGFMLKSIIQRIRKDIEIESVANGEEAIQKAIEFAPHVFLLDWMMPVMDGLEVTKALREMEAFKHTPIVMITSATPNESNLSEAFDAGVTDYISKPFNKIELQLRITASIKTAMSYQDLVFAKLKAEHATRELNSINRQLQTTQKGLESELNLQKDYNETLKNAMEMVKAAKEQLAALYTKEITG